MVSVEVDSTKDLHGCDDGGRYLICKVPRNQLKVALVEGLCLMVPSGGMSVCHLCHV